MHTYHLYFAYLMKTSEKTYIADELLSLSKAMLEYSTEQYVELKGTEWEEAALNNLALFYIGGKLQDDSIKEPVEDSSFSELVAGEIKAIMDAEGIDICEITGKYEDYSQYKPRGYYDGDEQLEKYFRAMMWYGRIPFALDSEQMVKSAILQTCALTQVQDKWNSIYKVTSFFAGASDDPGYIELSELVTKNYGQIPDCKTLVSDSSAFSGVMADAKDLKMPSSWKSSLAFDFRLPGDIRMTVEGLYNYNFNEVYATYLGYKKSGTVQLPGEPSTRELWTSEGVKNSANATMGGYYVQNISKLHGNYYSVTAQLQKDFKFGLSLMAAYTRSSSQTMSDGNGDQISEFVNTYNKNGCNTPELGYSSYVTPNRVIASASYDIKWCKFTTTKLSAFF